MGRNFFQKNKIKVLEWPAQSLDLNPIEQLWGDVKKVFFLEIKREMYSSCGRVKGQLGKVFLSRGADL